MNGKIKGVGVKLPDEELVPIKEMDEKELAEFLRGKSISLSKEEARLVCKKIGRNPTLTELHIFNIQWSEHTSYKSSRKWLRILPTESPNVILGPGEDSGIFRIGKFNGKSYGLVVSHESHNHPSQVVPYEGAATGVGGIIRDIVCMGAEVIATADPLRFGNPDGEMKGSVRYVANAVIDGIAGYGNPLGIPNLGGDVYFSDSFNDNCLVNVVALGIVAEDEIIHSRVPEGGEGFEVILVGKATDNSGFGGASFASLILDDTKRESDKGAVQVPDPFLKNVILRATYRVFEEVRKANIPVGFKDLGAGGIMCASSEMASSAGYGMDIDIGKVHVSMEMPPFITACSETQERFLWVVPRSFSQTLLRIYNEDFALSTIAEGARASVIGRVIKEKRYVLRRGNMIYCNVPVDEVTSGITYEREFIPKIKEEERIINRKDEEREEEQNNWQAQCEFEEPDDYNEIFLKVLALPHIASKERIYKHYDTEVKGLAVIRPGEADAGVMAVFNNSKTGIVLSVDSNPFYSRESPYWGAVLSVTEAVRNVAATGAVPSAFTDCLNYGNPEKPEQMGQFVDGVRGLSDAARSIYYPPLKDKKQPIPFVSGNVSFYNESSSGSAIEPSPIVACIGVINDYSKALTTGFKKRGSRIILLGRRKPEFRASAYFHARGLKGGVLPLPNMSSVRNEVYAMIELADNKIPLASHDISDGGMITALAEMCFLACIPVGAEIDITGLKMRTDCALFSETQGFIIEVAEENYNAAISTLKKNKVEYFDIGRTTGEQAISIKNGDKRMTLALADGSDAWRNGVVKALK